jgi:SAM-dependent methyltransferase
VEKRKHKKHFTQIFHSNGFIGSESRSGEGSGVEQTEVLRKELPRLLREFKVESMLDVPCGDWFWMRMVDLGPMNYVGADIVEEVVEANRTQFQSDTRKFQLLDVVEDRLPQVDLILCRDLLVHLNFADCRKAIRNMKKSGSKYLLTTTFPDRATNDDLTDVWRILNLQIAPFNFPKPLGLLNEGCTEGENAYSDKSLGLWPLADLEV